MNIGTRVKQQRHARGFSQRVLANRAGVSKSLISKLEIGNCKSGETLKLLPIALALGVAPEWLHTGYGPVDGSIRTGFPTTYEPSNYLGIQYLPLPGTGDDSHEIATVKSVAPIVFNRSWIADVLDRDPNDLVAMTIDGDHMEPVLRMGDFIIVDKTDVGKTCRLLDGQVYVVQYSEIVRITRIQYTPGNLIRLVSDNPQYPPIPIDCSAVDTGAVTIVGRVAWSGRVFQPKPMKMTGIRDILNE